MAIALFSFQWVFRQNDNVKCLPLNFILFFCMLVVPMDEE